MFPLFPIKHSKSMPKTISVKIKIINRNFQSSVLKKLFNSFDNLRARSVDHPTRGRQAAIGELSRK